MKTFELKDTTIKNTDGFLHYRDLIKMCLDNPPQGGFAMKDMKDRYRIEKLLEGGGVTLELEDADAVNLKALVTSMRWGARHVDILTFCDAIEDM